MQISQFKLHNIFTFGDLFDKVTLIKLSLEGLKWIYFKIIKKWVIK
jgi:hypothetical protein